MSVNWKSIAAFAASVFAGIGAAIFAPKPKEQPDPAPPTEPPRFDDIDRKIDEEVARGKSEPPA